MTRPVPNVTSRAVLRRALRSRPRDLLLACLLYSTHQLGEALVPVLVGAAIGQAIAARSMPALIVWGALLAADFVFLSLSYRFGARASARAKQHAAHELRLSVLDRALDPAGGADLAPGELLSRASSDADRVGAGVGVLASAAASAVAVIAASAFLLATAPTLGAVIVLGTVAVLGLTALAARTVTARSRIEQQSVADATVAATDLIRGLRSLAGIGAGAAAAAHYRLTSRSTTAAAVRAVDAGALVEGVVVLLTGLYLALVAGVAGWLALTGGIGLSQLVSALGLAVFLSGPLQTLTGTPASLARASASAGRIAEVLSLPPAVADSGVLTARPGDVTVRIADLAWNAPAGRITGVVARDPAVTARMAALLAREQDAADAAVLLDGTDIRRLPLEVLRALMVVGPHDAALFDETLRENVAGGEQDRDVAAAATAAFVDEVVARMPDGWTARAGAQGRALSGGQRQRIALARAFAADAPVLVLHDPTTAVDAVTEELIAARLRGIRSGRTTILLTASPTLLAQCDGVVAIDDDGARCATHAELWETDAAYREAVTR